MWVASLSSAFLAALLQKKKFWIWQAIHLVVVSLIASSFVMIVRFSSRPNILDFFEGTVTYAVIFSVGSLPLVVAVRALKKIRKEGTV